MNQNIVKNIVIVGGGTAGWMTAAALSKLLRGKCAIRLVESDEISSVGVGESTIPMITLFNHVLGIDENEFVRETRGTFKLGIEFEDWSRIGDRYMHGFGKFGQDLWTVEFYQYWLKMYLAGKAPDIEHYSINRMGAHANRFMRPTKEHGNTPLADITYAFHIDAGLYAQYLRKLAEKAGVVRTEGKVVEVATRADGSVDAILMEKGERIGGDFFIDCTGFRALLIEQTMQTGFEDWSHWLPCDRAWAVPCELGPNLLPYTKAMARPAGWQWRIGLQHRTGNGHVFSSAHMGEDEARQILLDTLESKPLAEPRMLRFKAGRRKKVWNKNVLAVGLSSGFLEPLESTSIHLIQSAIARLITFFPDTGFNEADIAEYNRQSDFEIERIRDFLILHYHATERDDTPFWNHVRTMDIPETLQRKIDLWRAHGRIVRENQELFAEVGWMQVLHGQRIRPGGYHPLADLLSEEEVAKYLEEVQGVIRNAVNYMPGHATFIAANCAMRK